MVIKICRRLNFRNMDVLWEIWGQRTLVGMKQSPRALGASLLFSEALCTLVKALGTSSG